MNIVHISTDDLTGGAAIAAFRLNEAMNLAGIDSKMLVARKTSAAFNVISYLGKRQKLLFRISVLICAFLKKKLLKPSYVFSLNLVGSNIVSHLLVKHADVIYIHWTQDGFLNIKGIEKILKTGKPVVMFMHDMWDITGGCHHSFDCLQYEVKCQSCPIIQKKHMKGIVSSIFYEKQKRLSPYSNLFFVTPSNWLGTCVKNSALFGKHDIKVIPNLVNERLFKPCDQQFARNILNLPQDKKLLLFGANGGSQNPYKGWKCLKDSIAYLQTENVEIVLFGSELSENEKMELQFPVHSLGYLSDAYSLTLMYNSADVYVTPSLAENFPNTILEALSCGVYAVGFNVGGIPDLIRHKTTGYLAKYRDAVDLAKGIDWALNCNNKHSSAILHDFVKVNYSYKKIIDIHSDYCKRLIENIFRNQ